MPTLGLIGHKISAGHVSVATMGSVSTIMSLPLQTDMKGHRLWIPPNEKKGGTPFPKVAHKSQSLAGTSANEGYYTWVWVFDYFTHDMYGYWLTQFLPSSVPSASVTVLMYDKTNTAIYLQATIHEPDLDKNQLTRFDGGYRDVTFEFSNGVVIT
jgi:hypothetical protein